MVGYTPLYIAIRACKYDAVSLLLENGADPNMMMSDGWTLLGRAVMNNEYYIANKLIEFGAHADHHMPYQGMTPMGIAAYNRNIELCTLLLHNGANINTEDTYHRTPLYNYLLTGGNSHGVNWFIEHKVDVDIDAHKVRKCPKYICKCNMYCGTVIIRKDDDINLHLIRGIMFNNKRSKAKGHILE